MGNTKLTTLVTEFGQLVNSLQPSLQTIRENMRRHFANLSDTMFHFGHYTSVHNIFLTLFRSIMPVTKTRRQCTNPDHAVFHESTVNNAMIRVSATVPAQSICTTHYESLTRSLAIKVPDL